MPLPRRRRSRSARRISLTLTPDLHAWVTGMANHMGLLTPADFVLLLIRLEKQQQDLDALPVASRRVFRPA